MNEQVINKQINSRIQAFWMSSRNLSKDDVKFRGG